MVNFIYVTMDHKTSHRGQFFLIEMYASSESKISFPLMYGLLGKANIWLRYNYLNVESEGAKKNQTIEKIAFKVAQMKSLAMHITYEKLCFDIITVGNLQNIFMEHDPYLISQ